MGSWDRLNDPVNYAGNLHTHPLRRQTVGNMRAGPVRNPPNLHTIPELDEEQKRWKQAQDENRDPLVDWANNYFQKHDNGTSKKKKHSAKVQCPEAKTVSET